MIITLRKILAKIPMKYLKNGSILIFLLLIYGIIGSVYIMNLNFLDSIYYSIITMATVGYGDIVPQTIPQKIFSMTLALSGFGVITYVFSIILDNFTKKMNTYSKGAKMYKINKMKDYYLLCGYGRVGKIVFQELRDRNQKVVLLEKDPEATQDIEENESVIILNRDATEDELLSKINLENCRSVIVTTGSDVTNLFIVLAIREIQPDAWVVSRCSMLDNKNKLFKAGADKVISPEVIGGTGLYFEAAKPHLMRITLKHSIDDIKREMEMIFKYNCTLENIEYHFPGIKDPLTRTIGVLTKEDVESFVKRIKENEDQRDSLNNLYESVHGIHSHWISSSDKANIDALIKKLEKTGRIIGIDLTNEEIAKITLENLK